MNYRNAYLRWLANLVGVNATDPYFTILCRMDDFIFVPMIDFDENREMDGLELRRNFTFEKPRFKAITEGSQECSMLELIIGIANRMSYMIDQDVATCFWHIMANLGLDGNPSIDEVEEAMETIQNRTYDFNGANGGLFPVSHTERDFRKLEIFQQMNEYLVENKFY